MPAGSFQDAQGGVNATGTSPLAVQSLNLHATTVAWDGRAVLIAGPSGSGKSALGLTLMAFGCRLVADDRTILSVRGERLIATCPAPLAGLIEAHGVGLLNAQATESAEVVLAIDMAMIERDRLPPHRHQTLLGFRVPLLHKVEKGHFAAAVLQYIRAGRRE